MEHGPQSAPGFTGVIAFSVLGGIGCSYQMWGMGVLVLVCRDRETSQKSRKAPLTLLAVVETLYHAQVKG